jgi:hypothetical protein
MCESHAKKEYRQESVSSKKIMPTIYIKGIIMKYPCMAMCEATNSKGDKGQGMRKRRSP